MLKSYLTIALRNLRKQKLYAAINIVGLAIGLACCLFILLYVRDELSYDRYHEKADRIYRLTTQAWGARTPPAVAPALTASYPHLVEQAVRLWPLFAPAKVRRDDVVFVESGGVFADPNVFSVFSWPMVAGTPEEALAAPNAIVLTQSMARKYFGAEDPLGATLQFWGQDMTVTGVMEDVPLNSHLRFDFLVSFSTLQDVMGSGLDEAWGPPAFYTYVLAREGITPGKIEAAAEQLYDTRLVEADAPTVLQPLPWIYLHSDLQGEIGPGGSVAYLYVLATVVLLVLLLACVNFTNLTTARAATRAKEVGMRKVLGAQRRQLVGQFLGETLLMSVAALLMALMLVELGLPAFNRMAGKALQLRYTADPMVAAGLVGLVLLVGLAAGSYPALFLSRFQPVSVLKGGGPRASNLFLRKGLVVFQFTVSTALSIGVAVVFLQLGYLQSKDLGFDEEQVLVLDGDRFPLVREALREVPGVVQAAGAPRVLGDPLPRSRFEAEGVPTTSTSRMLHLGATAGYIETMGMRVVAGRSFRAGSVADEREAFILNESAVRALGWSDPAEAIGKAFAMAVPPAEGGEEVWREGRVVGVVQDFHHASLHQRIEPVALYPSNDLNLTFVRVRAVNAEVLADIEAVWNRVNPDAPFNYYFMDEHLEQQYRAERQLSRIMGAATALAVLIACLGLLGLAAFTAEQRTKEIGVRKVLGASVGSIVGLLSKDFLVLVAIAALIAAPIAYVAMSRWLEDFAYRIDLGPGVFLLAGGLALLIALATVSYQALKAALADPVKSLRYE